MAATSRRTLHFVFKVADRTKTVHFYKNVLGMKILRHEEFEEGCKASCNGPYDGKWSKTMVGFGPEDSHFAVELTYNYGLKSYSTGNDFQGITVCSKKAVQNAETLKWNTEQMEDDVIRVEAPGGYPYFLKNEDREEGKDPVITIALAVSNLQRSIDYWSMLLGMKVYKEDSKTVLLGYGDNQCRLQLVEVDGKVEHAEAYGRIAFGCPSKELPDIEKQVKTSNQTILTPLVNLETPGKATVQVIILADPDGHEICFVGDEAFKELSQFDPEGDELLNKAIKDDNSDEWFAKKAKRSKPE